jgi:hypothetical protein
MHEKTARTKQKLHFYGLMIFDVSCHAIISIVNLPKKRRLKSLQKQIWCWWFFSVCIYALTKKHENEEKKIQSYSSVAVNSPHKSRRAEHWKKKKNYRLKINFNSCTYINVYTLSKSLSQHRFLLWKWIL